MHVKILLKVFMLTQLEISLVSVETGDTLQTFGLREFNPGDTVELTNIEYQPKEDTDDTQSDNKE